MTASVIAMPSWVRVADGIWDHRLEPGCSIYQWHCDEYTDEYTAELSISGKRLPLIVGWTRCSDGSIRGTFGSLGAAQAAVGLYLLDPSAAGKVLTDEEEATQASRQCDVSHYFTDALKHFDAQLRRAHMRLIGKAK